MNDISLSKVEAEDENAGLRAFVLGVQAEQRRKAEAYEREWQAKVAKHQLDQERIQDWCQRNCVRPTTSQYLAYARAVQRAGGRITVISGDNVPHDVWLLADNRNAGVPPTMYGAGSITVLGVPDSRVNHSGGHNVLVASSGTMSRHTSFSLPSGLLGL